MISDSTISIQPLIRPGTEAIWEMLETVCDPEIPVLSVIDLGIVQDVVLKASPRGGGLEGAVITITPTYSGCPAMDMITTQIRMVLLQNGYKNIEIKTVLSPAWTTDWMTEGGKQKLKAYGIVPPVGKSFDEQSLSQLKVECPQCGSSNTKLASEFGSTACKALFICNDCKEPFDHFKCH